MFDVSGRDKVQRRVGGGGCRGWGEVWWNTWCKCWSGLESLTCTEIWLLHITLLLSAESKASQLIQLTKMELLLHNCHNFYLFIYITTTVDVQIQ